MWGPVTEHDNDDATVEAAGAVTEALEWVEREKRRSPGVGGHKDRP
jgi:hypothetical protein